MLAVGALAAAGCGGNTKTFANKPPPATPVNLSIYINDARISVSPASVGAGPVTFIIANHSSKAESLSIAPTGAGSQPVATTGPINPQGTAGVNVDFTQQGQYTISTNQSGGTEASTASPSSSIANATLTVGPARQSARGDLNTP